MDYTRDYTGTIEAYDMSYLAVNEEVLTQEIMSTTFDKAQLAELRRDLGELVKTGVINQHNMVEFRRKLGVRGHLMDLSLGSATIPTLNHYSCLLSYAEELLDSGHVIHLIEATSSANQKMLSDVDLLTSFEGQLWLHDYTQKKHDDDFYGYTVLSESTESDKYEKLRNKFVREVVAQVVTGRRDTSLDMVKIDVEVYAGGPFHDDMQFYDSVLDVLPNMTLSDAKLVLEDYADRGFDNASYSGSQYLSSAPPQKSFFNMHKSSLLEVLQKNDEETGELFDKFQEGLESDSAKRDYFSSYYEKIAACKEKAMFLHPLPGRIREYNLSAYDRLRQIKDELGVECSTFIDLLLLSEDGAIHPTKDEIEVLKRGPDYELIKDLKIERLKRKKSGIEGELMSAFRLWYPPSLKKTMKSFLFDKSRNAKYKEDITSSSSALELEQVYTDTSEQLCRPTVGSRYTDDLDTLSAGIMTGEGLSEQMKTYVNSMILEASRTKMGSYLSFLSEMTAAMSNSQRRKFSCENVKGSIKSNQMVFSMDAVSDRTCVVITGMNLKLGEIGDQAYCTIQSNHQTMPLGLPAIMGLSRWSNMSSEDTNWFLVIYHKFLSWVTYSLESKISSTGKYEKKDLKEHVVMPALMMLVNSLGFAQTSESIRYLYLGSVGMSTDQYKIIEKISWYTPDTFVEKIYIMRMLKMINFLGVAKSNNRMGELYVDSQSDVSFSSKEHSKVKFRSLAVAFPNESKCVLREDHAYNMFYLCRAFQIDRQGELLGESLVVEKQKEAREEYLKIKKENRIHEARFRTPVNNVEDLVTMMLSEDYSIRDTDVYSPNALVLILGYISTLMRYKISSDQCLNDVQRRVYSIDDRDQFTELSSIMNNRGSLRRSGPTGVSRFRRETKMIKDVKTAISVTQNSKSYETLLQLAHDYKSSVQLPQVVEYGKRYDSKNDQPVDRGLTKSQLEELCNLPDNLSALYLYCISGKSLFNSKGTHKGDIAVREIATLNAAAKVCCKVVEDYARAVRDNEHGQCDTTNLIEIRDKDEIFKKDYIKSLHVKEPEVTLHDSADCSKWGPGMLSPSLYFVVASRMRNLAKRKLMRNFFFLFSQRIFKLPDRLYDFAMSKEEIKGQSGSRVEKICEWIRSNKDFELCDTENQYFPLEEGMYQGILGNCSSCLAADAARLNEFVQSRLMSDINFRSMTKVTSDDYNRSCVFRAGKRSISEVTRYSTGITMINQLNFGIRRNKHKSTMSTRRSELNSKYMDETGNYSPDIKSRLSYVDFEHGQDLVPSAIRASSLSAEYLRSEGSVVGAIVTQLLNTHLHMLKHGIRPLLRQLGNRIFNVPLELGGLVRIDPVLAVCSAEYVSLVDNYSMNTDSPELALKFLDEMTPREVENVSLDVDDNSMKSMVPRMSRSGVIHLSSREKRSLRGIRELMNEIPDKWFAMLKYPGNPSLLRAMISCIKREEANQDSSIRSKSFSACQTNKDALLYRLNSPLLMERFQKKSVSRQMLFDMAVRIANGEEHVMMSDIKVKSAQMPFDVKDLHQVIKDYKDYISRSRIVSIGNIKIKTSNYRNRIDFFPTGSVENMLQDFQAVFKPKILGGNSDVSPMTYLESEMMFREKVLKLSRRKQNFNFTMIGDDTGEKYLPRLVLTAGFARGVRPSIVTEGHYRIEKPIEDKMVETILVMNSIKDSPSSKSALSMDPLSTHFCTSLRTGRLKRMDLTNVINACDGNCDTFSFSSTDMKQNFLESLTSLLTDLKFEGCISPSKMRPDRGSYEYKLSGSDYIYQRPMMSEGNLVIGTETIIKRGKKYQHNMIKYRPGAIIRLEDTSQDTYKYVDLSQEMMSRVSIILYYGYVCLTMNISGRREIINILGTSVKSLLHTYTVITPGNLINDFNADELILRKHFYDVINEYEHSPVELELGYYPDDPSTAAPSVKDDEEGIEFGDELSDLEDDDDIMDFLGAESDGEQEEDEEGSYYEEEEEYYEEEEHHSIYDEERFSATLSREGRSSARYVLNQQKLISRSSIFYLNTAKGVKKVDRRKPPGKMKYDKVPRMNNVYEISLPYELSKNVFTATEDDDAFLQIISDVSKDVDSTWKLDYLIETILYSSDLMYERKMVGLE